MAEEPRPADRGVSGTPETPERVGVRSILTDRSVLVVMMVVFVIMMGFGVIAPILPLYGRALGATHAEVGLLLSAFAFARLVTDLFAGPLVDRFGERLSGSMGILFVALTSVFTGLAPNFWLAVVFRGIGGAGSAVLFAALYSYLLKVIPKDRMGRTLGVFYGSFNVGIIAGSPLGGFLAGWLGLRSPLFVYAGLLVVAGVLYLRFVPDPPSLQGTESHARPALESGVRPFVRETFRTVGGLLRNRAFVTTIFLNMAYFWVVAGGYDTLVPLFGQEHLGMTKVAIGLAFSAALLAELVVLYPTGVWADRAGRKPVLIPSLLTMAVMIAAVGWAGTPLIYVGLLALLGITTGVAGVPPSAMLADVVPQGRSGTAVGVFRFCGDLGFVLGPLVAGVTTAAFGFKAAFAVAAIPAVVALLLVIRTPETLRRTTARASIP